MLIQTNISNQSVTQMFATDSMSDTLFMCGLYVVLGMINNFLSYRRVAISDESTHSSRIRNFEPYASRN